MDTLTFAIVFLLMVAFLLIAYLHAAYKRKSQGKKGEKIINKKLKFWLAGRKNKIYSDLTLSTNSGSTTQIDHLLICTRGIFCIETKYLNGSLTGNVEDQTWIHINGRGDKNKIYNPIMQNKNHIRHVAGVLGVSVSDVQGHVVNVGIAKLKGDIKPFFGKPLIDVGTGFIFSIWLKKKNKFTQADVVKFAELIEERSLKQGSATNKKHLANIKKNKKR